MKSSSPSCIKRHARAFGLGTAALLVLGACAVPAGPVVAIDTQATVAAVLTTGAPAATSAPMAAPPATPELSFEAATYRNAAAGFEFDYPATWAVGPDQQYSRGGISAFSSWDRPTDVLPDAAPPGETRMDVTVQLWDPKGDLEAFVGQRLTAWGASGLGAALQGEWPLVDGRVAKAFVLEGANGFSSYVFITTLGDDYLVLSGDGDLTLLAEIAHTVRPTPLEY